MNFLKKILTKSNEENIYKNCIFVEEIVPLLSDKALTTNKTLYKIKKMVELNKFTIVSLNESDGYVKNQIVSMNKILSQNNIPIKVYDNKFLKGNFDENFSKNNYFKGDIYKFKELGDLGNISSMEKIRLVTDQYVIFDTGSDISLKSFEELDRLNKEKIKEY